VDVKDPKGMNVVKGAIDRLKVCARVSCMCPVHVGGEAVLGVSN